jgi:hypothetical protein
VKHPEPPLGSSQIKTLQTLKAAMPNFVAMETDRALEKLWKKGYVRWQVAGKDKEWTISKQGLDALERKSQ